MTKRIYNHIPDNGDHRDLLFSAPMAINLPVQVDYRPKMSPIFDQGALGSCTGNAIVGFREYLMIASGEPVTHLSRLYMYYKERELESTIDQDAGAMIRDGMKVLTTIGCAPETDCPYDISAFTVKPSDQSETDAAQFKIGSYSRVTPNASGLKSALASGHPVVFGFSVYDSFESQAATDTGIIPVPNTASEACLGGHALLAVGYNDDLVFPQLPDVKGYVIVRNSWGEHWGDKGYCYMPYAMFQYPLITDAWTGKLNTTLKASEVTYEQAVAHYGVVGALVSPEAWLTFKAMFLAGTLTNANFQWVMPAFVNFATRDMNLTSL